jgi:ABC-2 type transport system ATP-binding protein
MVSDNTMVQVENLTKRFGRVTAIDNLSFEVARGEIVGFLGPNGAGKTTTMRILACYMAATGGNVRIGGFDVFHNSLEVKRKIGYLPENVPLYHDMRVIEYLDLRGRLKGLRGKRLRERIDEVIACCGLTEERRSIIGRLSKGYRQRVGLADSLVHEPELLILDEPTIGLDPNQIRHIRNLIKSLAERHTVLLSTHILSEVEMICERVLIISSGRIVAADTTGNLVGLMKGNVRVIAEVNGPVDRMVEKLQGLRGVVKVSRQEPEAGGWTRLACECEKGADVREGLFRTVTENGGVLRELRKEKKRLEDVFVEITSREEE